MKNMRFENIMQHFRNLSHLTDEDSEIYIPTVRSAEAYIVRLMLREPEDETEQSLCEYACAAKAFYDYTILCSATSKVYSTQTGGIYAKISEDVTVKNAEKLMTGAFAAVPEGILRDDGFIFMGAEG